MSGAGLSPLEAGGLAFVAEMRGVPMPQLAGWLSGRTAPATDVAARATEMVARWRAAWLAESAALGVAGQPWVWATQDGIAACGLPYRGVPPSLSRLRHTRAVTEVRLSMERMTDYRRAGARWRSERSMLHANGYWKRDQHVPDAEVGWPDGCGLPWAGETWAIEVELTKKSRPRTAAIIADVLARTGDFGCPADEVTVPGQPPRYARVVYACSPSVVPVVTATRRVLGDLGDRVELYRLPESAARREPARRPAATARNEPAGRTS
jgi:hypothetical protein